MLMKTNGFAVAICFGKIKEHKSNLNPRVLVFVFCFVFVFYCHDSYQLQT